MTWFNLEINCFVNLIKHRMKSRRYIITKFIRFRIFWIQKWRPFTLNLVPRLSALTWPLGHAYDHRALYIDYISTVSSKALIDSFLRSTYNNRNCYSDVNSEVNIIQTGSRSLKYLSVEVWSKNIQRPIRTYTLNWGTYKDVIL